MNGTEMCGAARRTCGAQIALALRTGRPAGAPSKWRAPGARMGSASMRKPADNAISPYLAISCYRVLAVSCRLSFVVVCVVVGATIASSASKDNGLVAADPYTSTDVYLYTARVSESALSPSEKVGLIRSDFIWPIT